MHITTVEPSCGHLVDELEHGVRRLGVEARGRLVVEEQLGAVQHAAGQREAGLHAGRVAADLVVEGGVDAEPAGGLGDAGVDRRAATEAVELGRVAQVVEPGEAVVERGLGGHDAAAGADLVAVDGRDRARTPGRCPPSGVKAPGDRADGGRLAGAVRAEQHGDLAAGHREAEVVEGPVGAEGLHHAVERR